jgi:hypothetical protein
MLGICSVQSIFGATPPLRPQCGLIIGVVERLDFAEQFVS